MVTKNQIRIAYSDTGILYSECAVNELNVLHGECKTYNAEKKLTCIGNYVNGERDGVWTWFFPDGSIYVKQKYQHDKKRQYWIETDQLGTEHGFYERYYVNGQIEEHGAYDAGYKIDEWEKLYKNGNLEYRGSYKKDVKINLWTYFYPDGTVELEEKFSSEGKLTMRISYSPDGKVLCITKGGAKPECS